MTLPSTDWLVIEHRTGIAPMLVGPRRRRTSKRREKPSAGAKWIALHGAGEITV
jgi:hypothetical protein